MGIFHWVKLQRAFKVGKGSCAHGDSWGVYLKCVEKRMRIPLKAAKAKSIRATAIHSILGTSQIEQLAKNLGVRFGSEANKGRARIFRGIAFSPAIC